MTIISRRSVLLGAISLPSCTAISTLNDASEPRNTYDLIPVAGSSQGSRSNRTLFVLEPSAPAAIASDRILIKPDPLSVTYLPDARWPDDLPQVFQSLLIRSLSDTGRIGFVGQAGSGPIPDVVLLTRIDQFQIDIDAAQNFIARVSFNATLIRDRDQSVVGSRQFSGQQQVANDGAPEIVAAFQSVLNTVMPDAVNWINQTNNATAA